MNKRNDWNMVVVMGLILLGIFMFFIVKALVGERVDKEDIKPKTEDRGIWKNDFLKQLYEKDGKSIPQKKPEEDNPQLIELKSYLAENAPNLLYSNIEKKNDVTILYTRGVISFTDTGVYEKTLFDGLANSVVGEGEAKDFEVYRNGRPELFNIPNDQSGICLPEKEDLLNLGNFSDEVGLTPEQSDRFQIHHLWKKGLVARFIQGERIFEATLTLTDAEQGSSEVSFDCSEKSLPFFEVGEWIEQGLMFEEEQIQDLESSQSAV